MNIVGEVKVNQRAAQALTVRQTESMSLIQRALSDRMFQIGLALFVFGSGPLLAIIAVSKVGLTSDPNPNPVAFGILAMMTFWPSLLMMAVGLWRARRSSP